MQDAQSETQLLHGSRLTHANRQAPQCWSIRLEPLSAIFSAETLSAAIVGVPDEIPGQIRYEPPPLYRSSL